MAVGFLASMSQGLQTIEKCVQVDSWGPRKESTNGPAFPTFFLGLSKVVAGMKHCTLRLAV